MGLLDDAIREHLELKRRRGADATEVARQEQEAFGPSRRGDVEAGAAPPPTLEPIDAHDEPAPTTPDVRADRAARADDAAARSSRTPPPARRPGPRPAAGPAGRRAPDVQTEPPARTATRADELGPSTSTSRPAPSTPSEVRAATTPPPGCRRPSPSLRRAASRSPSRRAPRHGGAPPAARARARTPTTEAEDVLEETPEFLQETPEHDRLWFEQRPPRDFDF